MSSPFIKRLQIKNIFSFDDEGIDFELKPLNVLIGPNAVGKSNFINTIELLFSLPFDFSDSIAEIGGIKDVLWKGVEKPLGSIELITENIFRKSGNLKHEFSFKEHLSSPQIVEEKVVWLSRQYNKSIPYFVRIDNHISINMDRTENEDSKSTLMEILTHPDEFDLNDSVLKQRQDPKLYPEITYLRYEYSNCYVSGIFSLVFLQRLKSSNKIGDEYTLLSPTDDNFSLVVNRFDTEGLLHEKILPKLKELYNIEDIRTSVAGGYVQLSIRESNMKKLIPLGRISDGTLRFLRLLIILFNPDAPRVVCLEEPENGLHPEVIPTLAECLIEASERIQIIITTHSPELIDALSVSPESIVVCEREDAGTQMRRLDRKDLDRWLEEYRLGHLWKKGVIGGTRY